MHYTIADKADKISSQDMCIVRRMNFTTVPIR